MSVLPTDGLTELARQMQANSREAWERFAKEFRQPAFAYFRAQGFEASTADDLVQEAFVEALQSIHNLRKSGSLGAWFSTILRRVRNDAITEKRRARVYVDSVQSPLTPLAPLAREDAKALLSGLTPKQTDLLYLRYALDLADDEIAALTGLSARAVHVRIWECRRKLPERGAMEAPDATGEGEP